jgi:hypothetical protein
MRTAKVLNNPAGYDAGPDFHGRYLVPLCFVGIAGCPPPPNLEQLARLVARALEGE